MNLPQNLFDENINVQVILCQADKTRIGEILPYDLRGTFKFNTYSEISFSINKYYNDLFDGETRVNPYYDWIDSLRVIELRGIGHFVIQDVAENESESYTKSVTCFSLEYNTGQKYLESFYVNTGEEGSVETMYHAKQYGAEYSIDNYYTQVNVSSDKFDAYERYYIKQYSNDSDVSYNYVEEQVLDIDHFNTYDGTSSETTLYIKKYPNVRFYWPSCPGLSLLHLVFDFIPEWKIGHVDKELWHQERTFSEDRTAVYDFLYNTAAETLKFVMVWDSIAGTCSFYKTEEDGVITNNYVRTNTYNPDFEYYSDDNGTIAEKQPTNEDDVINGVYYINVGQSVETQWDTDVFISRENLASNIDIQYSTDDIKTKLKITGTDNLDVRDVNLGQNYILNLSFYKNREWMGSDLAVKYDNYETLLKDKTDEYKQLMSEWAATYNEYSDLMNYVPVEPRVMLIGDEFEKLYCTYTITKATEYVKNGVYYNNKGEKIEEDIVKANLKEDGKTFKDDVDYYINTSKDILPVLKEKLGLYRVGVDDSGEISKTDKADDVLLTLENARGDSATIRVRCTGAPKISSGTSYYTKAEYKVCCIKTTDSSGLSETTVYDLESWINGMLTADEMGLLYTRDGTKMPFTIKSIGTLGAYLCLAKDETKKENVEEYGIRLLQEKQSTYTKIFITQTEGYMSQEGSKCVAMANEPEGASIGDKWLKTDSDNAAVYVYVEKDGKFFDGRWNEYSTGNNSSDFENYTRFIDNYEKLQIVQEVLKEKQRHADLLLNGVANNEFYMSVGNVTKENLIRVATIYLILANNPYVISISQPSSDYGIEGMIWIQESDTNTDIITAEKRQYINNKWISYDPAVHITIISSDIDNEKGFGYITFKVENNGKEIEYAAYVADGIPYVSYARSQGLNSAKRNMIKEQTDMNNPNNFTKQELMRLSPFIREDEYNDSNFLLTTYESEEEEMNIKQELLNAGIEELSKICQPKLSFDMTMANILAIPEFAPLKRQFKLGNFIRVGIRDGKDSKPVRARLLEVNINFENASDFSCTFGNLISTKSEVDKHADLLSMAVQAGKSVASNKSNWQKGANKATEVDNAINDGLRNAALSIGAADGQAITWDRYGIRGRKLIDGTTDQYYDEQFALINNKLAFTTDNWKTSKAVVGEFEVEIDDVKQKMYGLLADALIGGYIQGTEIRGGNLRIGDGTSNYFQVDEGGNVTIVQAGKEKYASADIVNAIDQAYKYRVVLSYSGPVVFASADNSVQTTITATVYERDKDITNTIDASKFSWIRSSSNAKSDTDWNSNHKGVKQITVNHRDVIENSHFSCQVDMD